MSSSASSRVSNQVTQLNDDCNDDHHSTTPVESPSSFVEGKLDALQFLEGPNKQDSPSATTESDPPPKAKAGGIVDYLPPTVRRRWMRNSVDVTQGAKRPWNKTIIRFGPLSGILAMGLATLSIIASVAVLVKSDHDSVDNWPTPPSTYLAIFTALANLSMRYAAIQGVIIAWWVRALRKSSLSRLHFDWRSGTSLRGALTSGRHMSVLGLACIFSTIVVIDGPLLQRSSTVVQAPYRNHPVPLEFNIAPELPRDYTGYWQDGDQNWSVTFNESVPTPHGITSNHIYPGEALYLFASVVNDWHANGPISGIVSGCPGKCSAKLIAPALTATSCVTHLMPVNYSAPYRTEEQPQLNWGPPLSSQNFILSSVLDVNDEQEKLDIVTGFSTSEQCVGTLNYTVCTLEAASAEYDITIYDDKVTLDNAADPRILSLTDARVHNDTFKPGQHRSTLAGILALLYDTWDSYVVTMNINGSTSQWYQGGGQYQLFIDQGDDSPCPNFRDPRQAYLATINELMVYLGQAVAQGVGAGQANLSPNARVNTTSMGQLEGLHNVYHTDYWFLLGAALVEFVCICFVAPTYWGWWKLGRPVSLSPLEVAKAFEAPIFADANSNASGRDLARAYRGVDVQYGATVRHADGNESKLAFIDCNSHAAVQPEQGCYFDV